jgi:hypothetical protein
MAAADRAEGGQVEPVLGAFTGCKTRLLKLDATANITKF